MIPSTANPTNPSPATALQPSEEAIREYAFYLYEQGGHSHAHDADHWQEAEACLRANVPKGSARPRAQELPPITARETVPVVKPGHGNT